MDDDVKCLICKKEMMPSMSKRCLDCFYKKAKIADNTSINVSDHIPDKIDTSYDIYSLGHTNGIAIPSRPIYTLGSTEPLNILNGKVIYDYENI